MNSAGTVRRFQESNHPMNRLTRTAYAACALVLLAASLPALAEDRTSPSPTTTARMSGETPKGGRTRGKKLRAADVSTRRHGSRVNVRTVDDARKPPAAKVQVRKP
jgi:hypothetical protein